jgi:hypothetical protein
MLTSFGAMPAALLLDTQLLSRASAPPNGDGWNAGRT